MDARWFQLQEFLASPYARRGWVPLLGSRKQGRGNIDDPVYEEQFEGVAAALFPLRSEKLALSTEWGDVWGRWPTRAGVNDGTYFPPLRVDIGATEHVGELLVGVVEGGVGCPD